MSDRLRAVFFDEDDARAAASRLLHEGWSAAVERERLAGEDDDEDHPWAVVTDAPLVLTEVVVDEYDGWLDTGSPAPAASAPPPLDLPAGPRRIKRRPD